MIQCIVVDKSGIRNETKPPVRLTEINNDAFFLLPLMLLLLFSSLSCFQLLSFFKIADNPAFILHKFSSQHSFNGIISYVEMVAFASIALFLFAFFPFFFLLVLLLLLLLCVRFYCVIRLIMFFPFLYFLLFFFSTIPIFISFVHSKRSTF